MKLTHSLALFVLATVLIANGMSPYLGWKWEYSMSMYSDMKYDCSNHLFMSDIASNDGRFYVIERLELPVDEASYSDRQFCRLLKTLGHPARRVAGAAEVPSAPVSTNLLAYHLARMRREGLPFRMGIRDANSGRMIELSSTALPPEWTQYDLLLRYPPIRGDYHTMRELATQSVLQ